MTLYSKIFEKLTGRNKKADQKLEDKSKIIAEPDKQNNEKLELSQMTKCFSPIKDVFKNRNENNLQNLTDSNLKELRIEKLPNTNNKDLQLPYLEKSQKQNDDFEDYYISMALKTIFEDDNIENNQPYNMPDSCLNNVLNENIYDNNKNLNIEKEGILCQENKIDVYLLNNGDLVKENKNIDVKREICYFSHLNLTEYADIKNNKMETLNSLKQKNDVQNYKSLYIINESSENTDKNQFKGKIKLKRRFFKTYLYLNKIPVKKDVNGCKKTINRSENIKDDFRCMLFRKIKDKKYRSNKNNTRIMMDEKKAMLYKTNANNEVNFNHAISHIKDRFEQVYDPFYYVNDNTANDFLNEESQYKPKLLTCNEQYKKEDDSINIDSTLFPQNKNTNTKCETKLNEKYQIESKIINQPEIKITENSTTNENEEHQKDDNKKLDLSTMMDLNIFNTKFLEDNMIDKIIEIKNEEDYSVKSIGMFCQNKEAIDYNATDGNKDIFCIKNHNSFIEYLNIDEKQAFIEQNDFWIMGEKVYFDTEHNLLLDQPRKRDKDDKNHIFEINEDGFLDNECANDLYAVNDNKESLIYDMYKNLDGSQIKSKNIMCLSENNYKFKDTETIKQDYKSISTPAIFTDIKGDSDYTISSIDIYNIKKDDSRAKMDTTDQEEKDLFFSDILSCEIDFNAKAHNEENLMYNNIGFLNKEYSEGKAKNDQIDNVERNLILTKSDNNDNVINKKSEDQQETIEIKVKNKYCNDKIVNLDQINDSQNYDQNPESIKRIKMNNLAQEKKEQINQKKNHKDVEDKNNPTAKFHEEENTEQILITKQSIENYTCVKDNYEDTQLVKKTLSSSNKENYYFIKFLQSQNRKKVEEMSFFPIYVVDEKHNDLLIPINKYLKNKKKLNQRFAKCIIPENYKTQLAGCVFVGSIARLQYNINKFKNVYQFNEFLDQNIKQTIANLVYRYKFFYAKIYDFFLKCLRFYTITERRLINTNGAREKIRAKFKNINIHGCIILNNLLIDIYSEEKDILHDQWLSMYIMKNFLESVETMSVNKRQYEKNVKFMHKVSNIALMALNGYEAHSILFQLIDLSVNNEFFGIKNFDDDYSIDKQIFLRIIQDNILIFKTYEVKKLIQNLQMLIKDIKANKKTSVLVNEPLTYKKIIKNQIKIYKKIKEGINDDYKDIINSADGFMNFIENNLNSIKNPGSIMKLRFTSIFVYNILIFAKRVVFWTRKNNYKKRYAKLIR